jgi:hypothetical protein
MKIVRPKAGNYSRKKGTNGNYRQEGNKEPFGRNGRKKMSKGYRRL